VCRARTVQHAHTECRRVCVCGCGQRVVRRRRCTRHDAAAASTSSASSGGRLGGRLATAGAVLAFVHGHRSPHRRFALHVLRHVLSQLACEPCARVPFAVGESEDQALLRGGKNGRCVERLRERSRWIPEGMLLVT
jgi:hypothetical protein